MRYFKALFDDEGPYGVAYRVDKEQFFQLPYDGVIPDWEPIRLKLREGELTDYLASDLGCRLCSDRLRDILEAHAAPSDALQWLATDVYQGSTRTQYWILHFPDPPDVLARDHSIFAAESDFVVKPVLSADAAAPHHVFAYLRAGQAKLFVADPVRVAIVRTGCTGMEFSPIVCVA